MPRRRPTHRYKKQKLEKTAGDSIPPQIARSSSCGMEPHPSVYLVVHHAFSCPTYSVFKVNPFPDGGGGDTPMPLPNRVALLDAKHSMYFVPVRSRQWIVGVGGDSARDYGPETVVLDTATHQVIRGPKPLSTKLYPVVLAIGERIYALARFPAVKGDVNFVPWFEVLDLSQARVVDGHLVGCEWEELPRPPCLPWELCPRDYISPPRVVVKSYAAVGSYILLSISGQKGTHMFNVESEQWEKLDDKDLPFMGGAAPHGSLFLGVSMATKKLTAYKITVSAAASPSPAITAACASLSIVEFSIVTDMEAEQQFVSSGTFVSLGNHGFCSFRCRNDDPPPDPGYIMGNTLHTREVITMRAYTTKDNLSQEHLDSLRHIVVSNLSKQVYSICDTQQGLAWPCLDDAIAL